MNIWICTSARGTWVLLTVALLHFALGAATYGARHAAGSQAEQWVNLPSSPLILEEPEHKRILLLNNVSRGTIVRYALGCVLEDLGKFRVICVEQGKTLNLHPLDLNSKYSEKEIVSISGDLLDSCLRMKARVAIVQVEFEDGAVWQAPGDFSKCAAAQAAPPHPRTVGF
jgi:hypothetical protein